MTTHVEVLRQGREAWNRWREQTHVYPDLSREDLSGMDLTGFNFSGVSFRDANLHSARLTRADLERVSFDGANLSGAYLNGANLRGAHMSGVVLDQADLTDAHLDFAILDGAHLRGTNLKGVSLTHATFRRAYLRLIGFNNLDMRGANLDEANMDGADLSGANLKKAMLRNALLNIADLSDADLTGADLQGAILVGARLVRARLVDCCVYGVSTWNVDLDGAEQANLNITCTYGGDRSPAITVDSLEIAQFIHLLLTHKKLRTVIDTVGQKAVLILGQFSQERKLVLDAIASRLRELALIPIIFDFDRPTERDLSETIMTLAGMSLFVIVDVTSPRSSPLELQATVPNYMIPFVPILQKGEEPFAMLGDLQRKHRWVLDTLVYDTPEQLVANLETAVIEPAISMHKELVAQKARTVKTRQITDFYAPQS